MRDRAGKAAEDRDEHAAPRVSGVPVPTAAGEQHRSPLAAGSGRCLSALSEEGVTRTFRAAGVAVEHVVDDHRSGTEAVASRSYVIRRSA